MNNQQLKIAILEKLDSSADVHYRNDIDYSLVNYEYINLFNNSPYTIKLAESIATENNIKHDADICFISSKIKGFFAYREQVYSAFSREVIKSDNRYFNATLVPEFENKHDDLAIRIDLHYDGKTATVGYLPKGSNDKLDMTQNIKGIFIYADQTVIFPNPKDVEYLSLLNNTQKSTIAKPKKI